MPRPSVRTTATVNSGAFTSARKPTRASSQIESIQGWNAGWADKVPSGSARLPGSVLPRSILPPSYEQSHGHARRIELASDRAIRERNKISYRLNHWPIWIFVFFIAPGPMTFRLFKHGFNVRMAAWMSVLLSGTVVAGPLG